MSISNDQKVQVYIDSVCSHIKNRKVHEEIKSELLGHIKETVLELISSGIKEDEAIDKAIAQMGDASAIGRQLHKIHKTRHEWSVLTITILFSLIGLTVLYLMESKGALLYGQAFVRSMITTIFGLMAAVCLYFFDYRKLQPYSRYIYAVTLLVLIYVVHSGGQANGVRAWLSIGPVAVNWISASQFLFIIALAGIYDNWDWASPKKILYGLVLGVIPALVMIAAPSLAVCTTYLIALGVILAISGMNLKHMVVLAISGMGFVVFLGVSSFYRMERFLIFLHPGRDPQGGGWLNLQLIKATHSAGLWGQGFNLEPRTIPEISTDFIFTYIVYTFGWIAGVALALFIIAFLARIARIALVTKNNYGKLLVSGFVSAISIQFIWNILMNLSLAPISDISLPFISYGGTQFVLNIIAVAVILNVYKTGKIQNRISNS